MLKKALCLFALIALLSVATVIQAEPVSFSVNAVYDAMVANDDNAGPDKSLGGTGLHVRDISARRRVALVSFDISAIKDERATLEGVTLSVIAANGGTINVYGVIEELDNIGGDLTWNAAPGVANNPAAAAGDPVALDLDDLSELLLTISDIPGGSSTRVTSEPSQALTDFLNADTDGTITLLFAPPEGGQVILRSAVRWNNPFFTVESGASASLIANRTNNTVLRRLSGGGEGTSLDITTFTTARFELQTPTIGIENWTINNADPNSTIWFSPRYNGGVLNSVSINWVKGGALVLNGANMAARQANSGGNNVSIGSLAGDALSGISGANNAGSGGVRYEIGTLNTDTEFAGVIQFANGPAGMSIDKVGTGTLTLSGSQAATMVKDHANIDLNGGVVRVSEGTLALTNTFDHFVGGTAFTPTMIDVNEGAFLDVSDVNGVYYSSDMQQLQGSGTIVGNYIHAAASGFDLDGNADAVDDPGTILPGNVSTVGNLTHLTTWSVPTAGTLTFDGDFQLDGGSIVFDVSQDPASGNDLIHVTGSTALNAGNISLNYLASAPGGGTYTLVTSDGGFTGNVSNITITLPGRGTAPTPTIVGNDLVFTQPADAASANLTWISGAWDVQASSSWNDGSGADVFYNGDNVTFNATGNHNVNVAGFLSPSSVVIDSALPYSFTGWGAIMGSGSLIKNGSGDLKMHVLNGFSGDAVINGGDIDIDRNNGALGFGNLQINSDTTIISDGWAEGEKGQLDNGSITIAVGATLTMEVHSGRNRSGAFFLNNITGDGNLILSVTHNQKYYRPVFSGFTGNLAVFPYGGATVTGLRLNEGGTRLPDSIVDLTGTIVQMGDSVNDALIEFGELHGDADTVLAAAETGNPGAPGWNTTWRIGALGTDSDFAGTIQNNGYDAPTCCEAALSHLTKVGAGTLTLIGSEKNTYTGDTTVEAGTLSIDAAYLADTADVVLTTGAVLDLSFAGTDTIGSLAIDGVPQATGVWGAVGSGAANESPLFTGTGSLLVTVQ